MSSPRSLNDILKSCNESIGEAKNRWEECIAAGDFNQSLLMHDQMVNAVHYLYL